MNNVIKVWTIIGIYFFFSCNLNVIDSENTNSTINNPVIENTSETLDDNSGRIILHIPMIPDLFGNTVSSKNSDIFFDKDSKSAPLSKALGFATDVEVIILQGATVIQTEFIQSGETEPNLFEGDFVIPIGTGYTAQVNVYNSIVSETEPVVTGTSNPFEITARNSTWVTITALPYNPQTIIAGSEVTITGIPSEITLPETEDDEYRATFGTEHWFEIESCEYTSTEINIRYDTDDTFTGFTSIRVYDDTGASIGNVTSPRMRYLDGDINDSLIFASQIGATYYIRVIPLSVTYDSDSKCILSYSEGPSDDSGDDGAGNDTAATATPLTENTVLNAYGFDDDYYSFTINQASQIRIDMQYTNFVWSEYEILDSGENLIHRNIEDKNLTPNSMLLLDTGTYFIKVVNYDSPQVSDYNISWHTYIPQPANDDMNEDNDRFEDATEILQGIPINGISDDLDYYVFNVSEAGDIEITCEFSHSAGDIDIEFYNSTYDRKYSTCSETDNETMTYTVYSGGAFYIRVYPYDTDFTPYTLSWDITP